MKGVPHDCRHLRSVDYDAVSASYLSGLSLSQVADKFSVGVPKIRYALRIVGTTLRGRGTKFRKKRAYGHAKGRPLLAKRTFDYEVAKALYLSGLSLSQIASRLNVNGETVRKALHTMGVAMRRRGTHKGCSFNPIKGGKGLTPQGYIRKRRDFRGDSHGLEHRIIAERAIGRKLRAGEVVHHIDCNRANNRNDNLLVCDTNYHAALHARMAKHPYWSKFRK